ncbi:MAG: heavy-metal-associated domain-containing protein [Clostridia bacterium]|nr:heavy-metal-associated domain-containing protein [Clostridia bacterium]
MVVLKVENMHCEMCVARIRTAFAAENIEAEILLAQKTVAVALADKEKAIATLDDLGFDATL